jgi:hypothetical protein
MEVVAQALTEDKRSAQSAVVKMKLSKSDPTEAEEGEKQYLPSVPICSQMDVLSPRGAALTC